MRRKSNKKRTPRHALLKRLQTSVPRGRPIGHERLASLGISAQLAAAYVKSGWLLRLGRGVYAFPGDDWSAHGAVVMLQERVEGLHVGGRSALNLHGVRHQVSARETLILWSEERFQPPAWLTARYPTRHVGAHLFDWPDASLAAQTINTPPGVLEGLRVSTPERAALEMLYEAGVNENLGDARNVFEGLRSPRRETLGRLLACCTSIKSVRLFLTWARDTGLVDVDDLRRRFDVRSGSRARWIGRLTDGRRLTLRQHG